MFLNVEFIFSWLWGHLSWLFTLKFLSFLYFFVTLLIVVGITVAIYSLVRLYEIKQEEKKETVKEKEASALVHETQSGVPLTMTGVPDALREGVLPVNETWENIRSKLLSDSPSDWRLAIIEADIYLDRLLDRKGYPGDTLGDKLKQLPPGALPSLQIAWEAHKVRNRIAHEGTSFTITMPEARRVLSYYEIIFRDLGAIE